MGEIIPRIPAGIGGKTYSFSNIQKDMDGGALVRTPRTTARIELFVYTFAK
ncbi:MAG: hypothetical protein NUV51_06070 [Sulfuricaulis sp.]|nr:hypothetical protein [Sulfuricaulis sp.]